MNWHEFLRSCAINVQDHQVPPELWCVVKKIDGGYLWVDRTADLYQVARSQLIRAAGITPRHFVEDAAADCGFFLLHLDVVRDLWHAGLIEGDGMPPKEN